MRISYIDEKEEPLPNGKLEKHYYSVLVKGDDEVLHELTYVPFSVDVLLSRAIV